MKFFRNKPALAILCSVAALALIAVGTWVVVLNNRIGDIPRFEADFDRPDRPQRTQPAESLNVLMVGVDARGENVRQRIQNSEWGFRSDTMMIWHLEADRQTSQVISIPRDSWVDVPGRGKAKVNAAFSWGGPALLVETLENAFDIYLDHVAVVDFEGFSDITKTVGGVEVPLADGSTDRLEGKEALDYVRARKSLPNGDFDRIDRQQNFLRAMLRQVTRGGTRNNPVKMTGLVGDLSKLLVLDDDFTNGDLRGLGLTVARKGAGEVTWLTAPQDGTGMVEGQSIVRLNLQRSREMFEAISKDDFESYRKQNDIDLLPKPGDVA